MRGCFPAAWAACFCLRGVFEKPPDIRAVCRIRRKPAIRG
ncbi:hypothetical protein F528_1207 [Neisseria meningitidis 992008]|nr:hypothetical protein F528_1207 [Neisseria meningitidis 992008]